jgi:N-methylhydantoinase A
VVDAAVLDRGDLAPGQAVQGPAVIQETESTVVIGTGGTARVDESGALVVEIDD